MSRRHVHYSAHPCLMLLLLLVFLARQRHRRTRLRRPSSVPRRRLELTRAQRRRSVRGSHRAEDRLPELWDPAPLPPWDELIRARRTHGGRRQRVNVLLRSIRRRMARSRLGQRAPRRPPQQRRGLRPAERRTQAIRPRWRGPRPLRRCERPGARPPRVCPLPRWRVPRRPRAVVVDGRGGGDCVAEGEGGRVALLRGGGGEWGARGVEGRGAGYEVRFEGRVGGGCCLDELCAGVTAPSPEPLHSRGSDAE